MQFFRQQKQPVPQGGYEQPQQDPFDELDNMVDDINQQYYQQPAQQGWGNGDVLTENVDQLAEELEDHLIPFADGAHPQQPGQTGVWLDQPQYVEPAPQQYAEPAPLQYAEPAQYNGGFQDVQAPAYDDEFSDAQPHFEDNLAPVYPQDIPQRREVAEPVPMPQPMEETAPAPVSQPAAFIPVEQPAPEAVQPAPAYEEVNDEEFFSDDASVAEPDSIPFDEFDELRDSHRALLNKYENLKQEFNEISEAEETISKRYGMLKNDWENYRRRTEETMAIEKANASKALVEELLPALDDFERAITHAQQVGTAEDVVAGMYAIYKKIVTSLAKKGVEQVRGKGAAFDINTQQAVERREGTDLPADTVAEVYQTGYVMNGAVLRPALVAVTA